MVAYTILTFSLIAIVLCFDLVTAVRSHVAAADGIADSWTTTNTWMSGTTSSEVPFATTSPSFAKMIQIDAVSAQQTTTVIAITVETIKNTMGSTTEASLQTSSSTVASTATGWDLPDSTSTATATSTAAGNQGKLSTGALAAVCTLVPISLVVIGAFVWWILHRRRIDNQAEKVPSRFSLNGSRINSAFKYTAEKASLMKRPTTIVSASNHRSTDLIAGPAYGVITPGPHVEIWETQSTRWPEGAIEIDNNSRGTTPSIVEEDETAPPIPIKSPLRARYTVTRKRSPPQRDALEAQHVRSTLPYHYEPRISSTYSDDPESRDLGNPKSDPPRTPQPDSVSTPQDDQSINGTPQGLDTGSESEYSDGSGTGNSPYALDQTHNPRNFANENARKPRPLSIISSPNSTLRQEAVESPTPDERNSGQERTLESLFATMAQPSNRMSATMSEGERPQSEVSDSAQSEDASDTLKEPSAPYKHMNSLKRDAESTSLPGEDSSSLIHVPNARASHKESNGSQSWQHKQLENETIRDGSTGGQL